jgi:hypothetical protein
VALDDALVLEVDLGIDAEAADDARDRIPRHLDEPTRLGSLGPLGRGHGCHDCSFGVGASFQLAH